VCPKTERGTYLQLLQTESTKQALPPHLLTWGQKQAQFQNLLCSEYWMVAKDHEPHNAKQINILQNWDQNKILETTKKS
jgi:hypothetical protein